MRIVSILRAAGVCTALAALSLSGAACTADAQSAEPTAANQDTVITASNESRERAGIAYYVVHEDGTGEIRGVDGAVVATFRGELRGGRGRFVVEVSGSTVSFDYALTTEGGTTKAKLVDGAAPVMTDATRKLVEAMHSDFVAYGSAHSKWGCAFAGALIGLGAATLDPFVVSAGISIIGECG